jgi:hypothetical protein
MQRTSTDRRGAASADAQIAASLFKRATGYQQTTEKAVVVGKGVRS